jgi:alcohol dehydrogenase class IV
MHLRTEIFFGEAREGLSRLNLEGRGLLCTRRRPHFLPKGKFYHLKISPEPKLEEIKDYWEEIKDQKFDYILAIGGGSVLDVSKILGALMTNRTPVEEMIGVEKIRNDPPPIVAVPTTHGSGSEVTKYAVVRMPGVKRSVVSEKICPAHAIVDPRLALGLPKDLTLYTSIDALCHNLEAYFNRLSDPLLDRICEQGVRCFLEGIEPALEDRLEGRERMMLCSVLGGIAITNASTSVIHALSHVLGGRLEIPHGLANAVFLPSFLRFHKDTQKMKVLEGRLGLDLTLFLTQLYEKHRVKRLGDLVERGELKQVAVQAAKNERLMNAGIKPIKMDDLMNIVLTSQ